MWVTIVIMFVLLFIGMKFLRFEHHMKTVKIVLVLAVGAFLYFSMVSVFNSGQADFSSPRGVVGSVGIYFSWLKTAVFNLWDAGKESVALVGNAVRVEKEDENRR